MLSLRFSARLCHRAASSAWIPAFAGMTGVLLASSVVPAFAGMTQLAIEHPSSRRTPGPMLSVRICPHLRIIIPSLGKVTMLWTFARFPSHVMSKSAYVYMLASGRYGTLYIGVTSDLIRRVWQHREGLADGFTKKYRIKQLVWFETHSEIVQAITREKQLKEWKRAWKIELIQQQNPLWRDLYVDLV
jgi:putative endonuclease